MQDIPKEPADECFKNVKIIEIKEVFKDIASDTIARAA
jgi:hypothetical protein